MLIKNCMLIDGADIFEKMKDIRIVNGKIKEVADCLMPEGDEEIIDAEGALVTPGIVEPSCQVGVNSQIHRFEENDANEEGPIVPELRAYDALNFVNLRYYLYVTVCLAMKQKHNGRLQLSYKSPALTFPVLKKRLCSSSADHSTVLLRKIIPFSNFAPRSTVNGSFGCGALRTASPFS